MAKKVLILAAFPPGSAGGSWPIIEQLLKDYPKDKIAWWFLGEPDQLRDRNYCHTIHFGPIPWLLRPGKLFHKLRLFLFHSIIVKIALVQLLVFSRKISPDVVIAIPYGLTIPIIFNLFKHLSSRKLGDKPSLHASIHDMADTAGSVALLGKNMAKQYQKKLEWIYQVADTRDCVTREMGEELERQTGVKEHVVIMYGAEQHEIDMIGKRKVLFHSTFITVGYAGTIIATEAFLTFLKAVRVFNATYDSRIRIHLFTSHPYQHCSWYDPEFITHEGFLSGDEFRSKYNAMNYALCLMPLDESDHRYTGFSIPCKLTKSMSEGIPVICLAGKSTMAYRMISRYDAGFCSDECSPQLLAADLHGFFLKNKNDDYFNKRMAILLDSECHAARNRVLFQKLIAGNK
jgi:hypothetical protein